MNLKKLFPSLVLTLIALSTLTPANAAEINTKNLKVVQPAKTVITVETKPVAQKEAIAIERSLGVQPNQPTQVTEAKKPSVSINQVEITSPIKTWADVEKKKGTKRLLLKKTAEEKLGSVYSQSARMKERSYDCSSLVHRVLEDLGYDKIKGNAFTTYTMANYKFLEKIKPSELRPGDIVLGDGHVAFYWGLEDATNKVSLEACPNYGVTKGYIGANGWDFNYTSAWRVKGIDAK